MAISRIADYRVSLSQFNFLKRVAVGLSRPDYKLFCHIFVSTVVRFRQVQENSNGWLSIPKRFIQDKFRNSNPENLRLLGLIEIDRRYVTGKRPRRYRLKEWVLEGYVDASLVGNELDKRLVNIVTGKPLPARQLEPPNEPATPPLVRSAIDRFRVCYFVRPAVLEHLKRLRAAYEETPTTQNRFRYLNDWFILDAIDKLARPTDNPRIYSFIPPYTMQSTGRIGTLLQSASRAMKRAAYVSISDVFNYDLTSSQMALCLREFNRYGIDCPWLEAYLNGPDKRDELARYVGVSNAVWKECLYTILMTGHIPTNTAWKGSPIVEALEEELSNPEELAFALRRLRDVLRPLVRSLKQWQRIIGTEAKRVGGVTNSLGLHRPCNQFDKTSGMVAHLLQGMEAYFIHTLTLLADKYDFDPMGNEHDGLLTLRPIPAEAMREAQRLTGLDCLELREKPFA